MQNQRSVFLSALLSIVLAGAVSAQTTGFTYQGSLNVGGAPANGNYDFHFALYEVPTGGSQLGATATTSNIPVVNGVFTVHIGFGTQFSGPVRYLEIRVRPTGQPEITTLTPRQLFDSAPYAIRSLNAGNAELLGGLTAGQYVLTTDPRMTDARPPTAGSPSYIQNGASPQASSSFNISNTGTANIFNAATQYNLGGFRILSNAGTNNLFTGVGAGIQNTTGVQNTFLGPRAGFANSTGGNNTFVGMNAGAANTFGSTNSFFGTFAGESNTIGSDNSFFGESAGKFNTDGLSNSFFGHNAGLFNTVGDQNSFFGEGAGISNTTGVGNAYFGYRAGAATSIQTSNSIFGAEAGVSSTASSSSFFGYHAGAVAAGVRNSFFGYQAGESTTSGYTNTFVGAWSGRANTTGFSNTFVGQASGGFHETGGFNTFIGDGSGHFNSIGERNTFVGAQAGHNSLGSSNTYIGMGTGPGGIQTETGSNNTLLGADATVSTANAQFATAIGAGASASSNSITLGRPAGQDLVRIPGNAVVETLSTGGITQLCRNAFFILATCSSSARYKSNIVPFRAGLDLIRNLRPVSFNWKEGGLLDIGLVAEEVNKVEPLLTTYNSKGEVEGVKYDRVSVVLVNAIKEQQALIESLQQLTLKQQSEIEKKAEVIARQQADLDAIKKYVCSQNPRAELCQPK